MRSLHACMHALLTSCPSTFALSFQAEMVLVRHTSRSHLPACAITMSSYDDGRIRIQGRKGKGTEQLVALYPLQLGRIFY